MLALVTHFVCLSYHTGIQVFSILASSIFLMANTRRFVDCASIPVCDVIAPKPAMSSIQWWQVIILMLLICVLHCVDTTVHIFCARVFVYKTYFYACFSTAKRNNRQTSKRRSTAQFWPQTKAFSETLSKFFRFHCIIMSLSRLVYIASWTLSWIWSPRFPLYPESLFVI